MSARWSRQDLERAKNKLSPLMPGNKFNASKKEVDGIWFDSKHEAEVYQGLKYRMIAGEISDLRCHFPLRVEINGQHVFTLECDFSFREEPPEKPGIFPTWRVRYQDAKGYKKGSAYQLFRLKKAVIKAALGIEIEEV